MTSQDTPSYDPSELRRLAEKKTREKAGRFQERIDTLSPEEIRQTLHDLQVHQIELEMQNDELRRVHDELDASRARYFDLYNLAPVGYFTISTKGLILEANLTGADLLGLARSSLIKQPVSRFIFREDQDIYYQHRKRLYETGEPQSCELRILKKNGAIFWAHLDATVQDGKGEPIYRVVMSDISHHRELEDALQKAHDELETQVAARTAELVVALEDLKTRKQLSDANLLEIKKLKNLLEAERAYLQEEIKLEYNHEHIIGQSDGLKYVLFKIEQIAQSDTIILVLGETGTGKELVARAVHNLSPRKNRALVKVNCAALPPNLIESELFGHEKGSFTGSLSKHLGRFEVANGSTLFLDEIGELPIDLQAKLLRVIQDGKFERLGSSRTIKVDTRIIVATNRNLEEEVKRGGFREDLWYRLNVFPITMPPLRDRKDDIPLLVDHYVKKISRRMGKVIEMVSEKVMDVLQDYHWPGNVRELENVLERAVINSSGPKLHLMDELMKNPLKERRTNYKTMEAVEREHIIQTLEQTRWKISGENSAAEILGLKRSTLRARMHKLGIEKP